MERLSLEHGSAVTRLSAVAVGLLLALSGCGARSPRGRGDAPPREVAPLADLALRRDAVVREILEELSTADPQRPAMGNRYRALKWLGELRARDGQSVKALVDQMCAVGVPEILFGSERDREAYYPATVSLRALGGVVHDEVLRAGLESSDALRHRLTAWILRYSSRVGGVSPQAFTREADRALGFRFHQSASRIAAFINAPPVDTDPPVEEIRAARLESGAEARWKETPANWVARAEDLAKELRTADKLVPDLLEELENRHEPERTREWVLWLASWIVRSEEVISNEAPDRWLTWLPHGGKSLACTEEGREWEMFFPYAVFASRVGPGSGTEHILRTIDREKSPLIVDLATWVVVEALGRDFGAAALRAWARSEHRDLQASRRLQAAAERAARWEARPVPPSDVLRELRMGSWTFRRNCK